MTRSRIAVRPGPQVLAVNAGAGRHYAFDLQGRLLYAGADGVAHLRTPAGTWYERATRVTPGCRIETTRWVSPATGNRLVTAARDGLVHAHAELLADAAPVPSGPVPPGQARAWLELAMAWDPSRLEADGHCYRRLYRRPPATACADHHQAVLLQVADLTIGAFRDHAWAVRSFYGPDAFRREVHLDLGDESWPAAALLPYFYLVQTFFPVAFAASGRGCSAAFTVAQAAAVAPEWWREAATMGLRRVYLSGELDTTPVVHRGYDPGRADSEPGSGQCEAGPVNALVRTLHGANITVEATLHGRQSLPPTGAALSILVHRLGLGPQDTLHLRGISGWNDPESPTESHPGTVAVIATVAAPRVVIHCF